MSHITVDGKDVISMHNIGDELVLDHLSSLRMVQDPDDENSMLWCIYNHNDNEAVLVSAKALAIMYHLMRGQGYILLDLYNAIQAIKLNDDTVH